MPNMAYCRFQNTLGDLRDCYENWDDLEEESAEELMAREKMLALCKKIVEYYGEEEHD